MITVSVPLMRETRSALGILRRHWPRQFAFAASASEEAARTVQDYARALEGCELSWVTMAAMRWVAEEKFGPRPAELAARARAIGVELNKAAGRVDSPAAPVSRQHWEWICPRTQRITRLILSSGEWILLSLDDPHAFFSLPDPERIAFCQQMEREHGGALRRSA